MKIACSWIEKHLSTGLAPEEMARILTQSGLEVESIEPWESLPGGLQHMVVGEVLTCERIPETEKLSATTVDVGADAPLSIVCGAANVRAGLKVAVALVGANISIPGKDPFQIKKTKLKGVPSEGMLCGADEIGVGEDHSGILELDASLKPGTPLATVFNVKQESVLEIGLTPNRADAASHLGVSRDLAVLLNKKRNPLVLPKLVFAEASTFSIQVDAATAAPRYTGLIIEGVKVGPSPDWLRHALLSIGLKPINVIVDITNYVLHDLGQPMHAFDLNAFPSKVVRVGHVPEGTGFTALDGVERKTKAADVFICDAQKPLCLAGVMGGLDSGVKDNTTAIFLECAWFEADQVRRMSQRHALKSDSSFRFERGTDPNMPPIAIQYAASLILELAGGKITSPLWDTKPEGIAPFEVKATYQGIRDLCGILISDTEIKSILEGLECEIKNTDQGSFTALVPPYRVDVQRPADLAEEVLRLYGYDRVPLSETLQAGYLAPSPKQSLEVVKEILGQTLSANGLHEIITNSLTRKAYIEACGMQDKAVEIENKLSEELGFMRQKLLFSGLEVVAHNVNRKQQDVRIFETGSVYFKTANGYVQEEQLGLWLSGSAQSESWQQKEQSSHFYQLKNLIWNVLERFDAGDIKSTPLEGDPDFAYGLKLQGKKGPTAYLGLVRSEWLKLVGIKQAVYYASIPLNGLLKCLNQPKAYQEISRFPEVRRDLSLVLDEKCSYAEIESIALKTEKKLLKRLNVFDVYSGDRLGEGKKSYSLQFTLSDTEKTLEDQAIDQCMSRLMAAFEKEAGAMIRT